MHFFCAECKIGGFIITLQSFILLTKCDIMFPQHQREDFPIKRRKMKKTILILILALLLLLTLVACDEIEEPTICLHQDCYTVIKTYPTCEYGGLAAGKICRDCDEFIVAEENLDPLGHKYESDCDIFCNRCGLNRVRVVDHTDLFPRDNYCDLCGQDQCSFYCWLTEDGTGYNIHGYGNIIYGDLIIPSSFRNKPVTVIPDMAFNHSEGLTGVVIPNTVTTIGEFAFWGCKDLTSVIIPNSVTAIGKWAFADCDTLTDIYYMGTEEQWNEIIIGIENENLTEATIHFYYVPE